MGSGTTVGEVKRYEGDYVRLVPVVRGDNDERGVLAFVVWNAIEQAGDWDKIFFQTPPDPRKGDLYHWLSYLTNPEDPVVAVYFEDKETNALAGLYWFNGFKPEEKSAQIHLWIAPNYRGAGTREMGWLASNYAFEVLKLKKIIGLTPYIITRNLALRCGYKDVGKEEYDVNGKTMTFWRIVKEAPNG